MHNLLRSIWTLIACTTFLQPTHSAELRQVDSDTILIEGVVRVGDAEKLTQLIKINKILPRRIILDSQGGDVIEATRIASLIRNGRIETEVAPAAYCASACFFIFIAGNNRYASGSWLMKPGELEKTMKIASDAGIKRAPKLPGFVGLHRPYYQQSKDIESHQLFVMQKVREYLNSLMIPSRLTDALMSHPSNDIYWLSSEDLRELGNHPPDLEELYIRECGYDRNAQTTEIRLLEQGRTTEANLVFEKSQQSDSCIDQLNDQTRIRLTTRIIQGWQPESPLVNLLQH